MSFSLVMIWDNLCSMHVYWTLRIIHVHHLSCCLKKTCSDLPGVAPPVACRVVFTKIYDATLLLRMAIVSSIVMSTALLLLATSDRLTLNPLPNSNVLASGCDSLRLMSGILTSVVRVNECKENTANHRMLSQWVKITISEAFSPVDTLLCCRMQEVNSCKEGLPTVTIAGKISEC